MRPTNDPTYVQKIPVPNIPFVRTPFSRTGFRTDSVSVISQETVELVATIKQANTREVEWKTDSLIKGNKIRIILRS